MNQSNDCQTKCQQELGALLPNIQSTLYTSLFCKNKLTEPLDSLIFGFFIGFLSSRKEIKVSDSCLPDLLEIYFKCTQETKTFESLLQLLSTELTIYLYKNQFIPEKVQNKYPIVNMPLYNPNLPNQLEEDDNDDDEGGIASVYYETCRICRINYNIYDIANYGLNCGCIVHNKCFDILVKNNVLLNKSIVNCPICNKEVHNCFIMDSLMYNNPDLLVKYEKLTLEQFTKNSKDVKNCPTAGCDYIFFHKPNDTEFKCPKCNKAYCLQCKVDWHFNQTCYQYRESMNKKNDNDFIAFAQGHNYKKCPFCYVWVEKLPGNGGDQMHCRCGNDFCFNCGQRYAYNHVCPNPYQRYHYYRPGYPYWEVNNKPLTKKERKALRKKQIVNRNYH